MAKKKMFKFCFPRTKKNFKQKQQRFYHQRIPEEEEEEGKKKNNPKFECFFFVRTF